MSEDNTYSLASVIKELLDNQEIFGEEITIRKRFDKLLRYARIDSTSLKNSRGEIFFYEEEKNFIKALLIEFNHPYLSRLTSNKRVGKTFDEQLEEGLAFKERMTKHIDSIKDESIKKSCEGIIEMLSREQLLMAEHELLNKISNIGHEWSSYDLSYDEVVEILKAANKGIDKWYSTTKENIKNQTR